MKTMDHPLTDEICDMIQDSIHPCDPENMRAAYDLAVKHCVNWIYNYESDSLWPPSLEYIADELEKVMLPLAESEL